MKTILVPAAGTPTDDAVFATALAAARPLGAHLDFLHLWIAPTEAAVYLPHYPFARGAGLTDALDQWRRQADRRLAAAAEQVQQFCRAAALTIADGPSPISAAAGSASWIEERGDAAERLLLHARCHDLTVVGRSRGPDGLPGDMLERLLLGAGRPVLVAAATAPAMLTGTVLLCWKDTAEAARALAAARPLLAHAARIVVLGVDEGGSGGLESLQAVIRYLAWHGIAAEPRWVAGPAGAAAAVIADTAASLDAGLVVMGGYGHGRARELIFGGCTRSLLADAAVPVLFCH